MGLAERMGRLEGGEKADVFRHQARGWGWSRRGDVGLQLVGGTDGRSVRDVFVAGRAVLRDGGCVNVDAETLWREAGAMQQSLLDRAGIVVPHRLPQIDAH